MLGLGSVISFGDRVVEISGALGNEVLSLGSNKAPAAITLANGIFPVHEDERLWPESLLEVAKSQTIKQIAHGRSHGVAVSLLGSAYTWGSNDWGQCGSRKVTEDTCQFSVVEVLKEQHIIAVAAGDSHSLALAGKCALKNHKTVHVCSNIEMLWLALCR